MGEKFIVYMESLHQRERELYFCADSLHHVGRGKMHRDLAPMEGIL
jgi:hypothetical protein